MLPQNIGDNQASISSSRSRKSQRSNSPPGNQGLLRPPSGGVRRKNSPPSGQILSRASSGVVSVSPVEVNGREPIQVRSGSSGMFPELNQPQSGRRKSGNSQRGLPELVRNAAKDGVHLTGEEYQQLLKELENVDLTQEERMYLASQSGPQGEQLAGGKARRMSKQSSSNRSDTLSRNHPFFKLLLNRKNSSRPLNTEELALAAGGGGGAAEGGAPRALGPVSPVQTGSARGGGGGGGGGGLMAGGGARPAAAGAPGGAGGSNGGGAGLMETGAGGGGGGGRAPGAPAAEGFPPGGGGGGGGARGGRGAGLGALRKGSAKPGSLLEGMLGSELFGMQRIVLKFTTVSEGSEPSAFTVDTQGVRIGRGPENKVSIPSDTTMRAREHARIDHDPREGAFRLVDLGNRHGAAVRIPVGPGLREWPLREDAAFSAGNSVFVVVSVDGPGGAPSSSPPADGGGGGGGGGADGAAAAAAGGGGGGGGAGAAGGGGGAGDDAEPALFLEVTSGPLRGERRRVGREGAALGRATDNAISVADKELSRRHSLVEYDRGRGAYFLCDVGSTNGTYMQLVGPYANSYKLTFSDHILVGRTGFSINRFDYGVSEEIGRRPNMEDKSIIIQDLGIEHLYQLGMGPQSFVAVYDGHGGAHASNYLWRHLHLNVSEALEKVGQEIQAAHPGAGPGAVPARLLDELVAAGVARCFRRTDEHYLNTSDNPQCGSTATTVLIIGNRFYNFNVGDSRTLLCRNGKVRLVSQDHKPSREDETERIKKAGGFVIHKRVMGELAVSRAFGDKEFKMGLQAILNEEGRPGPGGGGAGAGGGGGGAGGGGGGDREEGAPPLPEKPLITAEPEILTAILDPEDDFIVLACDGVFDVMSNEEVAELIDQEMMQHGDTQRAVEMLSHTAIHKRRTRDNVTIVLVCLRKWWQAGQEEG